MSLIQNLIPPVSGGIRTMTDWDAGISLTGAPYDIYIQDLQVRR